MENLIGSLVSPPSSEEVSKLETKVPDPPQEAGTFTLKCTVTFNDPDYSYSYSWVKD